MDPVQAARMRRLVWIHAGRKRTMLVLSWRGLFILSKHVQIVLFVLLKIPHKSMFLISSKFIQ
jgi:hypothetical protein